MNKKIIFVGAPGSGKGTIAQTISKELKLVHISTGALFRNKNNEDSPEANEIRMMLNQGELIPDSITNKLAKDEILKCIDKKQGFILDGYPRNLDQAKYLKDVCKIDRVFYFEIDENILFKRITGRLSCNTCQRVYNIYFNPPKQANICDFDHQPLFQRKDDNKKSFNTRMQEYRLKTVPLINFYENLHLLDTINVNGPIDVIAKAIKGKIDAD